ncbi:Signal transduction histidine kinase [uncultured Mycobacterium sp.]|uniref:histidine kinase n=1 Tax=uncultured Mycobacterium sp. TaxID=171292 RepID=A0A1Y5PH69_9MYCO|nr:Signal transduction histidine kinase [uncultured Mycobacterium sp.]
MNEAALSKSGLSRLLSRLRLPHWSIAARSAFIAGAVVFVALAVAGAALTGVFYRTLIAGVDAAAAARVRDVSAGLIEDAPADLDDPLLATDQRIDAVQVIAHDGTVLRRSDSISDNPLVPLDQVGDRLRTGMSPTASADGDMRVSAQSISTPKGSFVVLVAGGDEAVESTVRTAVIFLLLAAPVVVAVAAAATYRLVRRSLGSVDAMRARVAAISSSESAERVPVPPGRDEISALAVTMNDMLDRIEAGHVAQRQFVGDASHELRSPLTAIISALDVAVAHPELLDIELARDTLVPEAQRMRALVEDLLLLARADERGLAFHPDQIRLDEIATGEVIRLRRGCPHAVHIAADPVELCGDGPALSRLVRNLLDNAARHATSRIDVTVTSRDGQAILTVADDGRGIPVADRQRVFDRFVRLDTSRSRGGGGSGLGLSIVAEIVAAHDGDISIADRPGGGTVVTVQVPLAYTPDSNR